MELSESTSTFEHLLSTLDVTPDSFLQPSTTVQAASLVAAKRILDPVVPDYSVFKELALKGLDVEQIWEQIRLVGDQVKKVVEKAEVKVLNGVVGINGTGVNGLKDDEESEDDHLHDDEDSEEIDEEEEENEDQEWEDEDEEMQNGEALSEEDDEDEEDEEDMDEFPPNPEDESASNSETEKPTTSILTSFKKDIHGLNDQFFSIDDFNRLTEAQDNAPSDVENADDIDYFGGTPSPSLYVQYMWLTIDPDEQDSDDEEENPDEISYRDFYLPPPNEGGSKKRKRAHFEDDRPATGTREDELDDDARINRFQKDLFADDNTAATATEVETKMSKHAKRQALIRKEVEQLEQENIASKEWMYTGEATSKDRPKNSLLEVAEEIDVERSVKPVPIVTEERTHTLEEIIKQRILANDFNDVIRKLPPSLTKASQAVDEDLQELGQKSQRGLAELYEQEHLRRIDPENNPTPLSVSVQKQHAEIDELWKTLSHQLDSLTSWRFIPTPEIVETNIVANIPAVEMEDARPEAEAGQTTMLAPQEVYRPRAKKGEVVLGGVPVGRVEMSREEKARNRKREGRRREKRKVVPVEGGRKDVVDTLKKGGVKIISSNGKGRAATGKGDGSSRGGRMPT